MTLYDALYNDFDPVILPLVFINGATAVSMSLSLMYLHGAGAPVGDGYLKLEPINDIVPALVLA